MIKNAVSLFFQHYTFYIYFICSLAGVIWQFLKKDKNSGAELWEKITVFTFSVFSCGLFDFLFSYVYLASRYGYAAEIAAVVILAALSFAVGAILCIGIKGLYRKIKSGALIGRIKENFVGFGVFAVFLTRFITQISRFNGWTKWSYAVDYSMGFGPRFFIGTLLSALTLGKPSDAAAMVFCIAVIIGVIVLVAVLLNRVAKKADPKIRPAILFFIICYLLSSGSIASFWTAINFGRLDIYIFLVALLSVAAFRKAKNIYIKYLLLAVGCVLANAIYQGFVFMFFSMTVIVILCDITTSPDEKKKRIVLGSLVILAAMASFLLFQLCSSLKFETADEMIRYLRAHSDIYIDDRPIRTEFFGSTASLYDYMLYAFANDYNLREKLFVHLVFSIPQIIVFVRVFMNDGFLLPKKKGINLSLVSLLTLTFLLPQFLLTTDWGRWATAGISTVYFSIFYLAYVRETTMVNGLAALSKELKEKKPAFVLLLIYMSGFSALGADNITDDFEKIAEIISAVKQHIVGLF